MKPILALIGFMGAGKTSIAQRLAPLLERPLVDLDAVIESMAGQTIPQIFAREGEGQFRRYEREALRQALSVAPSVLAVGGGTVVDPSNRSFLRSSSFVIWLDPEFALLRTRLLRPDSPFRPLVDQLGPAGLARLYTERRSCYAAAAHLRVNVGQRSPLSLARALGALLNQVRAPEPLRSP